jgi:hypothetical protein
MPRIAALCVAMLALLPLALCANCPTPGGITIDSSIRIFTDIDWKYGCHAMLAAAKAQGGSKINFIPTHFFNDPDNDLIPNSYALRAGKGLYLPPTPELLAQYTAGLTSCFKKAVTLGYTWIEVTPHLDDGDSVKALWRNLLRADPFEPYGGTSYVTALIDPLINALVAAVPAGVDVYMSIQVRLLPTTQEPACPHPLAPSLPWELPGEGCCCTPLTATVRTAAASSSTTVTRGSDWPAADWPAAAVVRPAGTALRRCPTPSLPHCWHVAW